MAKKYIVKGVNGTYINKYWEEDDYSKATIVNNEEEAEELISSFCENWESDGYQPSQFEILDYNQEMKKIIGGK